MFRAASLCCLVACTRAQIRRLPDCADCGRGEVRHGLWTADGEGSIAAIPGGGVVTLETNAVVFYDRAMRETRRVAVDTQDAALVAAAGSDAYVFSRSGKALEVTAIDGAGVRWRKNIGSDPGRSIGNNGIDAGPDGPFLYGLLSVTLPGGGATGQQVVALARDDGSVRWSKLFESAAPGIVPDDAGGVYVATAERAVVPGDRAAINHCDRGGAVTWTQTVAGNPLEGHWLMEGAALTAHGDLALTGVFAGDHLSVGDRTLDAAAGARWTSYLAVLDSATGAPARQTVIGDIGHGVRIPTHLTAMPGGDIAVASVALSATDASADAAVAVIGPAGVTSEVALGGKGQQIARSVVASDDGSVWLSLSSHEDDLYPDGATLVVGSQRFAQQGSYLITLVP